MSEATAKFIQAMRVLNERDKTPVQVQPAIVKSVEGKTCTVDLVNTDLIDVPGVALRADEDADEGVLLVPRVGSLIYVSMIGTSFDSLMMIQPSEVDRLEAVIEDTTVKLDGKSVSITQGKFSILIKDNKVTMANDLTSLTDIFTTLNDLLTSFQVLCGPAGSPSTAVSPTSLAKAQKLKKQTDSFLK